MSRSRPSSLYAIAATPSADGTINACYATTGGPLLGMPHSKGDARIPDEAEGCPSHERALNWNGAGAGLAGYEIVIRGHVEQAADRECPPGKRLLGDGGGNAQPAFGGHAVISSVPLDDHRWAVAVTDTTPNLNQPWAARAMVIRATAAP